ncbi:MAG: hypothetical protein ACM3O7_05610 [Acidobacteriota bacterium]
MIGAGQGPFGRRRVVGREVRTQRASPPRVGYRRAHADSRTGDVLHFRGHGLVSRTIRLLTQGPYSRVGLAFLDQRRGHSLAAVGSSVRLVPMSQEMPRYHGGIESFEVTDTTAEQREDAIAFGLQQLGNLYDRPDILRFLVAIVLNHRPAVRRDQASFCSELIAVACRAGGLPLAPVSVSYTSPADLALSPRLKRRYVLKGG